MRLCDPTRRKGISLLSSRRIRYGRETLRMSAACCVDTSASSGKTTGAFPRAICRRASPRARMAVMGISTSPPTPSTIILSRQLSPSERHSLTMPRLSLANFRSDSVGTAFIGAAPSNTSVIIILLLYWPDSAESSQSSDCDNDSHKIRRSSNLPCYQRPVLCLFFSLYAIIETKRNIRNRFTYSSQWMLHPKKTPRTGHDQVGSPFPGFPDDLCCRRAFNRFSGDTPARESLSDLFADPLLQRARLLQLARRIELRDLH